MQLLRRAKIRTAVFEEQSYQWQQGIKDTEYLAELCRAESRQSRNEALHAADRLCTGLFTTSSLSKRSERKQKWTKRLGFEI